MGETQCNHPFSIAVFSPLPRLIAFSASTSAFLTVEFPIVVIAVLSHKKKKNKVVFVVFYDVSTVHTPFHQIRNPLLMF